MLQIDISNVQGRERLVSSTPDDWTNATFSVLPITEKLARLLYNTAIDELTEANFWHALSRIWYFQRDIGDYHKITEGELKRHIGIRVNTEFIPLNDWLLTVALQKFEMLKSEFDAIGNDIKLHLSELVTPDPNRISIFGVDVLKCSGTPIQADAKEYQCHHGLWVVVRKDGTFRMATEVEAERCNTTWVELGW